MMRLVIGLPGGGKTYYVTMKIIEELRFTERFVVTNCQELDLPRIREYLQELDPDREKPIDLDERLLVIPKEETFRFYRYRSGGLVLPMPRENGPDGRKLKREEFLAGMVPYFLPVTERPEWSKPVSYFIVEAHDYFNAQDWQEVGRAAQYYATKHRHLHDEVVLETQLVEQCDASMRRLVEQTHEIENHYQRSFGPFANRGCFKRRVYFKQKVPTSVPYEVSEFKLDAKGIGSCYHTTGALGMMDRGTEAKGFGRIRKLPWWTLWAAGALGVVAIFALVQFVPVLIGGALGSLLKGTTKGIQDGMGVKPAAEVRRDPVPLMTPEQLRGSSLDSPQPAAAPAPAPAAVAEFTAAPDLRVRGYVMAGRRVSVFLSDGRTLTERDPELQRIDRAGVTIAGRRYAFIRPQNVPQPVELRPPLETPPADPGSRSESPAEAQSAWRTDPDGVQRLKQPLTW